MVDRIEKRKRVQGYPWLQTAKIGKSGTSSKRPIPSQKFGIKVVTGVRACFPPSPQVYK